MLYVPVLLMYAIIILENYIEGVDTGGAGTKTSLSCNTSNDSMSTHQDYNKQGYIFTSSKNYQDAFGCYSNALEMSVPYTVKYYSNRAYCAFQLGKYKDVIDDCKKALFLDPFHIKANFFLGSAYLELEDFNEAVKYLELASKIADDLRFTYGDDEVGCQLRIARLKWRAREEERLASKNIRRIMAEPTQTMEMDPASDEHQFERKTATTPTKQYDLAENLNSWSITVTEEDVVRLSLEMVTKNGRPFIAIEDSSQELLHRAMRATGTRFDRRNISELVASAAKFIQNQLVKCIHDSLVSVRIGRATHNSQSWIGIDIHVNFKGKMLMFLLPVFELEHQHTGKTLEIVVLRKLKNYGIHAKNIYCITLDIPSAVDRADQDYKLETTSTPDKHNTDKLMDVDKDSDCTMRTVDEEETIINARCAANVLQLAVLDTLNNQVLGVYLNTIKDARELVRALNTERVLLNLGTRGLPPPELDCQTMWISTYHMLKGLLLTKSFCEDEARAGNMKLNLPEGTWFRIEEIKISLDIFADARVKLQAAALLLIDVYEVINMCRHLTAEIGSSFSENLLMNLTKRRDTLVRGNPAMLNALYLDPRFCSELDAELKEKAIQNILKLHEKVSNLNNENDVSVQNSEASPGRESRFETSLRSFQQVDRMDLEKSVLQFWEEAKSAYPLLYPVASIVLSAPGTQSSNEQIFSQLDYISDNLHQSLSSSDLENVLMVRSNYDILLNPEMQSFFE